MMQIETMIKFTVNTKEAIQFTTTGDYPSGCTNPMEWECECSGLDTRHMKELWFCVLPEELVDLVKHTYDAEKNELVHMSLPAGRGVMMCAFDTKGNKAEALDFDYVELVSASSDLTEKYPPRFYVNLVSVYEDCGEVNIEYGPWEIPDELVKRALNEYRNGQYQQAFREGKEAAEELTFENGYDAAVNDIVKMIKESGVRSAKQVLNLIKTNFQ